ncbi:MULTISPECIES: 5-methylcytosine restriction system specificity protein McrC [unclassified Acidisoma]|uniref:5-methylcytosine restriction system specificity protein McrC n=1 Tax=unclassified Acidisoma TaxID=2634065 RepID=UPI00131B0691
MAQDGRRPCTTVADGGDGLFQTRPDLLIKRGEKTVLIADKKWKKLLPGSADRKQGVAQSDIYQ